MLREDMCLYFNTQKKIKIKEQQAIMKVNIHFTEKNERLNLQP